MPYDTELHARFIQILGRTYPGQTWSEVEPYAKQAWNTVAWREPRPRENARDRLQKQREIAERDAP